jgi:hypothetical protein
LRKLEASLHAHVGHRAARSTPDESEQGASSRLRSGPTYWRVRLARWWPFVRRFAVVSATLAGLVTAGLLALWWRLSSGPIELDIATPWLTAAIEENFGQGRKVEVGGTQLERDARGRTALRLRDVVVRDADGTVVASAPKAEVGVSGAELITGRLRAERLSLVGAEMAVRIEPTGKLTVFAGADKRPLATASVADAPMLASASTPVADTGSRADAVPIGRTGLPDIAAFLAWINGLGATGLDGRDLSELGLKNGNLVLDDERTGKQWTFTNIDLSLTRPPSGGITLTVGSEDAARPWMLRASMQPSGPNRRIIDIEAQKVSAKDLLLLMRLGAGQYEGDLPLSGRIRAEIGPDGRPRVLEGRILVDKGFIVDGSAPDSRIDIDRADFTVDWDASRGALVMPFQIVSGGNRLTLLAEFETQPRTDGTMGVRLTGGTMVLGSQQSAARPLILNRVLLSLRVDPQKQRIDIEQGEIGNMDLRLAISGGIDYSAADPKLALGIAGTRMPAAAFKRLWPVFISPTVRAWIEDNLIAGSIDRVVVATNMSLSSLRPTGPPIPDDGLSIEIAASDIELRPVAELPTIRNADLNVQVSGSTARVTLGRGNVELSAGRKLTMTKGVFEVPDTNVSPPPARVRFRMDGSVPAAAELLAMERLRGISGAPVDPAASRGMLSAQVALQLPLRRDLPPGSSEYAIDIDLANFAADRMVMGHRVEAGSLRVNATTQGYQIKGDVKINGIPASVDYRKPRSDADAEIRLQATLDAAARARLGFDLDGYLNGQLPIKLHGRVPASGKAGTYTVEADLTQVRIDDLLPGWAKPVGRAARASFNVVSEGEAIRLDDLIVSGAGTSIRGSVAIDAAGEVAAANFPVFSLSDGDKATLKAERGADGALRVEMRGDVFDGRHFVKSAVSGPSADREQRSTRDVDLDIRLGTVAGYHGETVRGLELRLSRRGGEIKSVALNARLGRDASITGDMRASTGGRRMVHVRAGDAGALFRFTDTYAKMYGGEMSMVFDPPAAEVLPQDGTLNVRDFVVRGEPALDRVVAGAAGPQGTPRGAEFTHMRVEFTRLPGRFAVREGIVRGPTIGATVEGTLDYRRNEVRMRGTFVPLYGLNNMFGQIPLFGIFLGGGSNEGLVGVTYEVVGSPGAPILRVNPISAVAPGLLRKFFEFPNAPQSFADPAR